LDAFHLALYLGLGAVTGLLSGLFGLGGGFLVVPILALAGWSMAAAVGTSLVYVAVIGLGGTIAHLRARNVDRRFVTLVVVPAALLAPAGAAAATRLPDAALAVAFGVFLALMAGQMGRKPAGGDEAPPPPRPAPAMALGASVGLLSGMFGVGGGLLFVPAQVAWFRIPIKRAVGNSLAAVLVTGVVGIAAHAAIGNVAWTHAAVLVLGGTAGLFGGTRLLGGLSPDRLRAGLLVFLYLIAAAMVVRGFMPWGPAD
jgi:uncharacterized membrane protein YfcA